MKRKRFHSLEAEDRSQNPALKVASAAFFTASFAFLCAGLLRFNDGLDEQGTVLLLLGVVNLCLSLLYGQRLYKHRHGGERRRHFKREKGGRSSWHS